MCKPRSGACVSAAGRVCCSWLPVEGGVLSGWRGCTGRAFGGEGLVPCALVDCGTSAAVDAI